MYNGYRRKKVVEVNMSNIYKQSHITLLITFKLDFKVIWINSKGVL